MRGKHCRRIRWSGVAGITPADAGKTIFLRTYFCAIGDHPRGCGENQCPSLRRVQKRGSPPRMRGKHNATHQSIADNRITPADAGKTLLLLLKLSACRDHPRGCGENFSANVVTGHSPGSPPRMRGKQSLMQSKRARTGITPADAGKTLLLVVVLRN